MDTRKIRFMTERFEKDAKFQKLQEEFIALPGKKVLTGKFSSRHDAAKSDEVPRQEFVDLLKRSANSTPKNFFEYPPPTSSME